MKRRLTSEHWSLITLLDGAFLALFIVAVFTAEAFDDARGGIQSVADHRPDERARAATPWWLVETWRWLALASLVIGVYVVARFVWVARQIRKQEEKAKNEGKEQTDDRANRLHRSTPVIAIVATVALVLWLVWQLRGIAVVDGGYGISKWELFGWHLGAVLLGAVALGLGGAAVGNAALAAERRSLVRVQLGFLAVLYLLVFHASFLSDQLTDVLRGWGDGPGSRIVSRPLAGLAAAVLLGAVVRASATRILLPPKAEPESEPEREPTRIQATVTRWLRRGADVWARVKPVLLEPRDATRPTQPQAIRRRSLVVGAVVLVVLSVLHVLAALAIAVAIVAVLWARSSLAKASDVLDDEEERGLRRLAGTLGVIPVAILLGGLTIAAVDSLLLPSGPSTTDKRLFVCTIVVALVFAVLASHTYVAVKGDFKRGSGVNGKWFGLAGLVIAAISVGSTTVAAFLLAFLAGLLASRRVGEAGTSELWAAWGLTVGLALAIHIRPVDLPRGLGGFAVALLGATAVLAALHPLASLGARYQVRLFGRTRHTPVTLALGVWLLLAWATAAPWRTHVPTVPRTHPVRTLDAAVATWLAQAPEAGGYRPMVLVAASGGGAKAAYWTDLVLDCMLGEKLTPGQTEECPASPRSKTRAKSIFLTSSVSGGSVGIYQFLAHHDGDDEWIKDSAGKEVLSPLLAWGLFHDLPGFLLGAPTWPQWCGHWLTCRINADRAGVQAAAVGAYALEDTVREDEALTKQSLPVTIFNSAQVSRIDPVPLKPQRRAALSRLTLACRDLDARPIPDAIDARDLLASDRDLTTLSSALLSARFPVLEPPGRVGAHPWWKRSERTCDYENTAKLRDGGTYENTGMMTLMNLVDPIKEAVGRAKPGADVRLIVVSVDDDVPSLDEEEGWLKALWHKRFGDKPGDRARDARDEACAPNSGVTYMRLSPQLHVGAQAATGWEISETSRQEDLVNSLREGAPAGDRVQQLREMLDGTPAPIPCQD